MYVISKCKIGFGCVLECIFHVEGKGCLLHGIVNSLVELLKGFANVVK